ARPSRRLRPWLCSLWWRRKPLIRDYSGVTRRGRTDERYECRRTGYNPTAAAHLASLADSRGCRADRLLAGVSEPHLARPADHAAAGQCRRPAGRQLAREGT